MADSVGFEEVLSPPHPPPPPPLFSSVETLYHITSRVVLPRLKIGPIFIHSKPLVSVDQVRFCGELLFFPSSFFFFFFPHLFFFSSLPILKSVPGRAHFLPLSLFFSSLLFPLFYTSFFPSFFCPTLVSSSYFPPAFHFILFPFFLSILVRFFFFHQSTFITIPVFNIIYNQC